MMLGSPVVSVRLGSFFCLRHSTALPLVFFVCFVFFFLLFFRAATSVGKTYMVKFAV